MVKNIRRKVVSFEFRPNLHPESSKIAPQCSTAILECGHRINLGICAEYQPKRMACSECGVSTINGVHV